MVVASMQECCDQQRAAERGAAAMAEAADEDVGDRHCGEHADDDRERREAGAKRRPSPGELEELGAREDDADHREHRGGLQQCAASHRWVGEEVEVEHRLGGAMLPQHEADACDDRGGGAGERRRRHPAVLDGEGEGVEAERDR